VRQNLSVYLDRVKAGESLEVTEHGRPVAILAPVPGQSTALQRLVASGRATPPTPLSGGLGAPLRVQLKEPLSRTLRQLREDRP
jgi:antitoxin (DNA-binding transcriptional repressor) of toxin-antitoxin stability system